MGTLLCFLGTFIIICIRICGWVIEALWWIIFVVVYLLVRYAVVVVALAAIAALVWTLTQ